MFNKNRSRITVGFHRVGIVLAAPFLVGATIAAVLQWQNPTGAWTLPAGTLAYRFGDDLDSAAKRIIDQQHGAGYKMPFDDDMMIVGLPLGTVRYNNLDWTRIQLPDGREIGVESTDLKKVSDVAREFLLAEKRANRSFTDKDRINFNGVPVEFLSSFAQSPTLATSPLQHKERNWTWALLALSAGLAIYVIMRAIGWIVNGFARGRAVGGGQTLP